MGNLEEIETRVKDLNEKIAGCTLCRLCKGRTRAVPGAGPLRDLGLMIVGEAPGRNEDLQGEPFVGAGGKLLDSILELAGLSRFRVYITNVVKCRPPENRKPLEDEIEICTKNYLEFQIAWMEPKLICSLGATALEYFTGEKSMGKSHGKLTKAKNGYLLLPTYHPAAILRNPALKPIIEEDMRKIPPILAQMGFGKQRDLGEFLPR